MSGLQYFFRGLTLLPQRGIREFVVIPLLINLLVFALTTWFLWGLTDTITQWATTQLGDWVERIIWLLWLVLGLLWLIVYGYSFSMVSNTIAAPFYGLLAEQVQYRLTGKTVGEPLTIQSFLVMTRRTLTREWQKLMYILPRFLGLALVSLPLYFIPVIGMLVPVVWFLWGAWSLSMQNMDYAADNNQVTFPLMKGALKQHRLHCLAFGGAAVVASSIPLFNMLAVPAAVAGGTAMWLDKWGNQ